MSYVLLAIRTIVKENNGASSILKIAAGCESFGGNGRLSSVVPTVQCLRNASFFSKVSAKEMWKGITSVSNAGRKRGRGKAMGKKAFKDLNKGQVIGVGKENIVWPGLSGPVLKGRELVAQKQLPPDPEREAKLIKLRDQMGSFRRLKVPPIERGWSGTKLPGRSIGPPDPIGEDTFEGFDSIVLKHKGVFHMEAVKGRTRSVHALVVTGNKNGLAGFALSNAPDSTTALRRAKNRAAQKLMFFERYNNHTVLHDFFQQFGKTKIFVEKRAEGYGLVCHRAIREICKVVGIKDIYAKVEGSTNVLNITKAFFLGLMQQKTHQKIAEEKGLYLVEQRKEHDYFPVVVGSPETCRTKLEPNEVLDVRQYVMGGKVVLERKKPIPFYTKCPLWPIRLMQLQRSRHDHVTRLKHLAEYGFYRSFLYDKYPECRLPKLDLHRSQKLKQAEENLES